MKCFLIAMNNEAEPIIKALKNPSSQEKYGFKTVCGELYGEKVKVVVCGIGKANAARGAQFAIDSGCTEIINIGVAGGLKPELKIGAIYGISAAVQYDYDLTQLNGTAIGTLDEFRENYIPLQTGGLYPLKRVGTGDRFNDSPDDFKLLTQTLNADIREMECAAIAQTCVHCSIPLRAYKIISDVAGSGSTTEQYLKNLEKCFDTLGKELENIIKYGG